MIRLQGKFHSGAERTTASRDSLHISPSPGHEAACFPGSQLARSGKWTDTYWRAVILNNSSKCSQVFAMGSSFIPLMFADLNLTNKWAQLLRQTPSCVTTPGEKYNDCFLPAEFQPSPLSIFNTSGTIYYVVTVMVLICFCATACSWFRMQLCSFWLEGDDLTVSQLFRLFFTGFGSACYVFLKPCLCWPLSYCICSLQSVYFFIAPRKACVRATHWKHCNTHARPVSGAINAGTELRHKHRIKHGACNVALVAGGFTKKKPHHVKVTSPSVGIAALASSASPERCVWVVNMDMQSFRAVHPGTTV